VQSVSCSKSAEAKVVNDAQALANFKTLPVLKLLKRELSGSITNIDIAAF
jgi:hypothetical protein